MPVETRRRRFTIWHAALLLPWVVASYGFGRTFNDNSYLWHVRAGDWQLANGRVLDFDPFSFTMEGAAWRTQSWLAELLYAPLDDLAGLSVAPAITTVCATLAFVLLGIVAYRWSGSVLSTVVYLVATSIALAGFINPRPVIFSFPLFAAVVVSDADRRLRWALPLLLWIWASVHGSFIIGLAYLTLRAIGRRLDFRTFRELVFMGIPTLLTAHGLGIFEMLLAFAGNQEAIGLMSEWGTPDLLSLPFLPVFLAFLALIYLGQRGQIRANDWLLLVPFLALAVSANRSVPPAWIGLTPVLARLRVPIEPSRAARPVAVLLAAVIVSVPLLLSPDEPVDTERLPVTAAKHLETDRVFHSDAAGGWLIYSQWPERQVYIDDRAELFGEQMVRFSQTRSGLDVWKEEFDRWSIEEALLSVDDPLAETLRVSGWSTTYEDESFVVLRDTGPVG